MQKSEKEKPVSLRLPNKTKMLIDEESATDMRGFNDEVIILIAEALHHRKAKNNFTIKDYT